MPLLPLFQHPRATGSFRDEYGTVLARRIGLGLLLAFALPLPGLEAADLPPDGHSAGYVRAEGSRFVDASGRQIILHGLNIVDKSANWSDYSWVGAGEYAKLRDWGFSCVRLGFTWASVEPQPGQYSTAAVAEIRKRVGWAKQNGLYVVLDMHQDLYSMKYSDGAPEWATLTDGKPHIADGKVWSDAYVSSPAVQTAMDNFYANKEGPGGVGLQDRYAGAWRYLATQFADEPAVVGYDLMNEPFAGSLVPRGMVMNFAKYAQEMGKAGDAGTAEIVAQWSTPKGRAEILQRLDDVALYARVIDVTAPLFQEFERSKLTPFYERVSRAIREVDGHHLIFLETGGSSNMGVFSAIEPLRTSAGARDPQQAYAPHGYDLVTDTPDVASASLARTGLIFRRHGETARRLGMPMWIGEWGAYYGNSNVLPSAQFICRQFERLLCGDAFWALEPDLDKQAVIQALRRPYPMCVAGEILAYGSDPDLHRFECVWQESEGAVRESRFYLPADYLPGNVQVLLEPAGPSWHLQAAGEGSPNRYLIIPARGHAGVRKLVVRPAS